MNMKATWQESGQRWGDAWAEASWLIKAEAERLRCGACSARIAYDGWVRYVQSGLCPGCDARDLAEPVPAAQPPGQSKTLRVQICGAMPHPGAAAHGRHLPSRPRLRMVGRP
jgi:hypothetical protein